MSHKVQAFNETIMLDSDNYPSSEYVLKRGWVAIPFTHGQESSFKSSEILDEPKFVSSFITKMSKSESLTAIFLDDNHYKSVYLTADKIKVDNFIKENFIFNFMIVGSNMDFIYLHDNYNDVFLLFTCEDNLRRIFGKNPLGLQSKYLNFWMHPESDESEKEVAEYIYSKYTQKD